MDTNDWNDAERRVERAQELFEQRKLNEALEELRAATDINPYNANWFFNLGVTLDELGRHGEASDAYTRALEINPDDVPSLQRLALDHQELGRNRAALELFARIHAVDAAFEPAYCAEILTLADLGEHERADETFYLARLYKEHCPNCYYNIGISLASRGLYDKAIYCWRQALEAQEKRSGPPGTGLDRPTPLVELPAQSIAPIHVRIAEAQWAKGELEMARLHFVHALRSDPGNVDTLLDLSQLLAEMRRHEEAGEKIRRAVEMAPDHPGAQFCLGHWSVAHGRPEDALAALKRVLEVDPTYPGVHLMLAEIHHRRQDEIEAKKHLRAELLLRPDDARTLMDLSNLLVDVGEIRQALASLRRLVQLEPDFAAGWQNLAVAQFMRRRYTDGVASCHQALRLEPRNLSVIHNLALAYGHMRRYDLALAQARRGLALSPRDGALTKLEFRLQLQRIQARVTARVASLLARFGRGTRAGKYRA